VKRCVRKVQSKGNTAAKKSVRKVKAKAPVKGSKVKAKAAKKQPAKKAEPAKGKPRSKAASKKVTAKRPAGRKVATKKVAKAKVKPSRKKVAGKRSVGSRVKGVANKVVASVVAAGVLANAAPEAVREKPEKQLRQKGNNNKTVAVWRESQRIVNRRKPKSQSRRDRLEKDAADWLKYYFPHAFKLDFGTPHHEQIERSGYAIKTGGSFVMAAPRGTGKSAVFWGLCLYYVLTGELRFPAYCPWDDKAMKRGLRFWKNALCFNRRLAADYPEYCDPFIASKGSAQRCLALLWDDGTPTGAQIKVSDGMIVFPDGLGVMGSSTINGNPRGLNLTTESGEVLRPDCVFLDDVQDKDVARSAKLTSLTIDVIDTDVMGMAGPDTTLPALMACTVLTPDDVSSHYLSDECPDWESYIVPQVEAWPEGWEKEDGKVRGLWVEWNRIRLHGTTTRDGGKAARAFYKKHRAVMIKGMQVSWSERYDRKRLQPDAYFSAMFDYFRMGHASFMAERQNAPVRVDVSIYDIKPELIISRVDKGRRPLQVPEFGRIVAAGTDLNHYGLHTSILAMGNDQSSAVIWYGNFNRGGKWIVPKNSPEAVRKKLIYEALVEHGNQLAAAVPMLGNKMLPVGIWMVDGGYEHEVVQRYVRTVGSKIIPNVHVCRGFSGDRYRPTGKNVIGKPQEQCHMTEWPMGKGIAFNACYWREVMQRAWLGSVGAPGACSLYDAHNHREYAEQICRERLIEKFDGKTGVMWKWHTAPGRHDYSDSLYQAYVGCAWLGIGTAGPVVRKKRYKERRKCQVARS